jgi:hypothetical protein
MRIIEDCKRMRKALGISEVFGQPGSKGESMTIARRYTTKRIEGGIAFKCEQCEYRVTTLDFQSKDGNVRTQAATAVNLHAVLAHHEPMLVSPANQQRY